MTHAQRPVVWHLSADFPDPFDSGKTPVIRSLVEATGAEFDHRVISLNRVSPGVGGSAAFALSAVAGRGPILKRQRFEYGEAIRYSAPPKGLFHANSLARLGVQLAAETDAGSRPDLIVAHKLTVEGIASQELARRSKVPFAVQIQGNTDTKILAARPDLKRRLAQVFHEARVVFSMAPWALSAVETRLGIRAGATIPLPAMTELDQPIAPQFETSGFVSAFHLRHHKNKNLAGMVQAAQLCRKSGNPIALEVIGGGSPEDMAAGEAIIAGNHDVKLAGAASRAEIAARFNSATGLVLPSLRESFGLVFVEALFAGTPIIYPADRSVSGYFDGAPFALAVDPNSPRAIAEAMQHLGRHETEIKRALAEWQVSEDCKRFQRDHIAQSFSRGLREAISARPARQ